MDGPPTPSFQIGTPGRVAEIVVSGAPWFPDGSHLVEPDNNELAAKTSRPPSWAYGWPPNVPLIDINA